MKNKVMKRILVATGVLACSLCLVTTPAVALPVEAAAAAEEGISPCSDTYQWIYKVIDGKRYKRLYNATTQEWIGEWIYIGEA